MNNWALEADGVTVASGCGVERVAKAGRDPTRYLLSGIDTRATPPRECFVRLMVDGKTTEAGRCRVERWGSALLVLAPTFTIEASKR